MVKSGAIIVFVAAMIRTIFLAALCSADDSRALHEF